jgi:hypothetical protein
MDAGKILDLWFFDFVLFSIYDSNEIIGFVHDFVPLLDGFRRSPRQKSRL